ncbi:MAG: sigma 54-interacting transcriptional regulator [Campylobacterales bacterium]|nr:sigma 54-interacting transcriptional regulator [Campylobacterales bacterium]
MKNFIAQSATAKKILNIANMASSLPVNVLIVGEVGVGKKILANEIAANAEVFEAKFLEHSILNKTINLDSFKELIITNLDLVINKKEFMEYLDGIKIIATSHLFLEDLEHCFAIKIDIPPLESRPEDLQALKQIHYEKANEIFKSQISLDTLEVDLSKNGLSLKQSIYKNLFVESLNDEDIQKALQSYFEKKLQTGADFKALTEVFEIPLLHAAKNIFGSQLQMANNLQINRMTLRKKIENYNLGY